MPYHERAEIMRAIRYVDAVVPQESMDKLEAWKKYQFDIVFHGNDKGSLKVWKGQNQLRKKGVKIILLTPTQGVSSTLRRDQHGFNQLVKYQT